jgi:hypothetical protein
MHLPPSPLEYAIMAKLAYVLMKNGVVADETLMIDQEQLQKHAPQLREDIKGFFAKEWELFGIYKPAYKWWTNSFEDGGYHGACFVHRDRKLLVVSHRGTQTFDDLATDLSGIVLNGVCNQQRAAESFCAWTLKKAEGEKMSVSDFLSDFRLSFTGHSLGGWLGQCSCASKKNDGLYAPAVVFDAPGAGPMLDKLFGRGTNVQTAVHNMTDLPIEIYLSAPNLLNTCAASSDDANFPGVVWRIYPSHQARDSALGPLIDWLLHSSDQHCMTSIIHALKGCESDAGPWRRRVRRWPRICWKDVGSDVQALASAIKGLATGKGRVSMVWHLVGSLFSITGIEQDINSYHQFFGFGNKDNSFEPNVSHMDSKEKFDLRCRAVYETENWDEKSVIPMLLHPEVGSRLQNFFDESNRAHRDVIQGDTELMEWLGSGKLVRNARLFSIIMTSEDYSATQARKLPSWFASILLKDEAREQSMQRVKWFNQSIPPQSNNGVVLEHMYRAERQQEVTTAVQEDNDWSQLYLPCTEFWYLPCNLFSLCCLCCCEDEPDDTTSECFPGCPSCERACFVVYMAILKERIYQGCCCICISSRLLLYPHLSRLLLLIERILVSARVCFCDCAGLCAACCVKSAPFCFCPRPRSVFGNMMRDCCCSCCVRSSMSHCSLPFRATPLASTASDGQKDYGALLEGEWWW